jgi:hypothetical protein
MESRLTLDILPQPDDVTCGPTCLHAVYRYHYAEMQLDEVIKEVPQLPRGGTLAVHLGKHALDRGFDATIYTYNLEIFDPTWWAPGPTKLREKLLAQKEAKADARLGAATDAYIQYLDQGGIIRFQDLTAALIRKYLVRQIPIITGLSATYLYRTAREYGPEDEYDDVRGEPSGHFVVLYGYHPKQRTVLVADPISENPVAHNHYYEVSIDRLVGSILLGILTHDANLLIIRPSTTPKGRTSHVHIGGRQQQE